MERRRHSSSGSLFLGTVVCADDRIDRVTAQVNPKARLSLSAESITFADADPDSDLTIPAPAVTIGIKARTSASGPSL